MRIPFIAGNWKMYKNISEAKEFAAKFRTLYHGTDVKTAIFAPYPQLPVLVQQFKGTGIGVGAQNVHFEKEGAYTGEVSAPMLKEIGVDYCLVGHSERRQYFGETDKAVNLKLKALLKEDILPVLCVGENLDEREGGIEEKVVASQVKVAFKDISSEEAEKITVAYEPVWAIGTGRTATPEQAEKMCGFIRKTLSALYDEEVSDRITIQYGGSVKPDNAYEIMNMPEIDGALVGGASLEPLKFIEIVNF
ncbi:MAG: triose-phosphate isomerase [Anaerovoracaceae bacterium]|nr:triose-phosphate isomerase [Bacillota bacterium]MEE0517616.1 triose-phosphate isomerase [Anaerovoracaceae bacterium]